MTAHQGSQPVPTTAATTTAATTTAATTTWHGEPAVRVDGGGGLGAVLVPGRGGKITSLVDAEGIEWLAQPGEPLPPPARPGVSFVEADMCGWDECVPTVDADTLGELHLPDHGEAWMTPWSARPGDAWGFDGRVLPYRFSRAVVPTGTGLRLTYEVVGTGEEPGPLLWAAHPQFAAPPGSRVVLPPEVHHVAGVYGVPVRAEWSADLASVDTLPDGAALKYWVDRQNPASWAGLATVDGTMLRLSWDPALVPYLALWVDAGMFSRERVVAIEPSTGSGEALSHAAQDGACLWLEPGVPVRWWIDLDVVRAP